MQSSDAAEQPNRIQVVVRVRPVQPHELSDEVAVTCAPDARRLQVLLPDRLTGTASLPGTNRSGARSYEFDACLAGNTTQEDLFEICGLQELVEAALDGYCVTIFAFGQTGSGKTHTIIGPRLSRGAAAAAAAAAAANGTPSSGTLTRLGSSTSAQAADGDILTLPAGLGSRSGTGTGSGSTPASARPSSTGTANASGLGPPVSTPPLASIGPGNSAAAAGGVLVDPEDGVLTRCIAAAYRSMAARSAAAGTEFNVSASVVELYNENVTDLLALDKNKTLQVRKDSRDGFAVTGLTQVACPTDTAAVRYLVRALQYRHTRSHRLNEYSSRSHCLMTFVFASREGGPEGQMGAKGGIRRYGKLSLVDLAGSERLKDTGNTERGAVRETGAINKSLFTLGQVLAALSARSSGAVSTFVPYRDSKLTQLLWDGLRGSGRCLMLACLGPMRGAAEESLNTLHFATMATRIKAEPVVLLDPQDQLVLDLRKVISQLRQENRQLASALHQMSQGADPNSVIWTLPEALRATAAQQAAAAAAGGMLTTPPALVGTMDDWSQQRQPTAGSDSTITTATPVSGVSAVYGNGLAAPSPSASPQPLLQSGNSSALRASQGSSVMAYGGGGPVPRGNAVRMSPDLPSSNGTSAASSPVATRSRYSTGSGPAALGGGVAGQRRRHSTLNTSYTNSPQRTPPPPSADAVLNRPAGSKLSSGSAAKAYSSPPRDNMRKSRSVGRNVAGRNSSARPSYLTEDPGALLFGYSNALPASQGSAASSGGSGGATSLPAVQQGGGMRRANTLATGPPPPPALSEFPELAAMEAEFQNLMAQGGGGGGGGAMRNGNMVAAAAAGAGTAGAGAGDSGAGEEEDAGPAPDVRALKWAERNAWFGTDYDMTALAYQVHDQLVDVEHVDPTSDLYYMEIERRVAAKFPQRWAAAMKDQLPGGSGAAAAAGIRRAVPSPARQIAPATGSGPITPVPAAPPSQQQQAVGAGLRVNLKEPLPRSGSPSGTAAALARARQQGVSYESGSSALSEGGLTGSQPATPLLSSGSATGAPGSPAIASVNPFNIGALHSAAPPKSTRVAPLPGGGPGVVLIAGASDLGSRGSAGASIDAFADPNAAERIQREYQRQRALVVEELRRAKEEAEAERQRILNRIQRAAGGSKWR
ncbi:hypothetical protein Agub_g2220 [Astrephomene gubernaculifera]|uniref:Kinesin motor domain-containing protein n=1 Tax=Astrephomene gubernaculifera TaxID=47775 RepID=A0AAD3HHI1_9CHLO|nr:hypothetical protein Agub_g2220 [Astrephomene gubernaculifera]